MRPISSLSFLSLLLLLAFPCPVPAGELLPCSHPGVTLWWAYSSATKIKTDSPAPEASGQYISIQSARNESEAVQLILRTSQTISQLRVECGPLVTSNATEFPPGKLELLRVANLNIAQPTDKAGTSGLWPDPLLPIEQPLDLSAGTNHVFWIRVFVPRDTPPGTYRGNIRLRGKELSLDAPLQLVVWNFTLPDRLTCQTAFGFSPGEVFQYHGLKTDEQKRLVLEKYLDDMAAHHISPYDPAPLDPIQVKWPDVRPPRSVWDDWTGLRIVTNEVHTGAGALLINDDQPAANVTVTYEPLIPIPASGLRFHGWFRTPVPGHRFSLSFNHYDSNRQWMSGRNHDVTVAGTGKWQAVQEILTNPPPGAAFIRLHIRATVWTDRGENLGLVWADDLSLVDQSTGRELLPNGDFEPKPRTQPLVDPSKLKVQFDFTHWDRAMTQALDLRHFTSFQVHFPGLGGGTFHSIEGPSLLGFHENDPEYPLLMASYGSQLESHLRERGWLDRAFVYWFDEPSPDQYPFVMNGFAKLKRYAPDITRMLTEQVEPGLIGGPNLWCPISNEYKDEPADARRREGERFWWYVCTGPKAPYTGLFIDHPAPELRIWLWQTWQRHINGILVWQLNYWTSSAAYPDPTKPQDPFQDPMSWTSGYSTPAGRRLPWGNGDGRFIYPPLRASAANPSTPVLDGPIDSIRWEHLRDGLEDYEYFCILQDRLHRKKANMLPERISEFEELLKVPTTVTTSMTSFTNDGAPLEAHRRALAAAIQKL